MLLRLVRSYICDFRTLVHAAVILDLRAHTDRGPKLRTSRCLITATESFKSKRDFFVVNDGKCLYKAGLNWSKSRHTSSAALDPSSIAPSIKLRHPTAQSELAKKTFP